MGLDMYLTRTKKPFEVYQKETENIGYWRKSNQIHSWFVENVQNGVDECQTAEVGKEHLEKLLAICQTILKAKSETLAKSLLPPTGGFFFGSTSVDDWYYEDITNTIEILTKVLDSTDFDTQQIWYHSSW